MIEVGEYIRTEKGEIGKLIKINTTDEYGYDYYICDNENATSFRSQIVKHSKNIIDLIEIGDYVNGREVKHIAMFEGFPDYPKLIFVDEKHLVAGETAENKDIKTILTKEQYEQNCYKVKED